MHSAEIYSFYQKNSTGFVFAVSNKDFFPVSNLKADSFLEGEWNKFLLMPFKSFSYFHFSLEDFSTVM